jgi:hypothetical protein
MRTDYQLAAAGFMDCSVLLGATVYALLCGDELVYLGRSRSMVARLMQHRRNGLIRFDRLLVRRVEARRASKIEADLIRRFRPAHNYHIARPLPPTPWPREPVTPMERRG